MDGITGYCSVLSSNSKAFYLMTIFVSVSWNFYVTEIKTGFTSSLFMMGFISKKKSLLIFIEMF